MSVESTMKDATRLRRAVMRLVTLVTLLAMPLLGPVGCMMELVAPEPSTLREPAEVRITNFGMHAGLVLPRDEGNLGEYAFGEWEWFALEQNQWYRSFGALLIPSESPLSRRLRQDAAAHEATSYAPRPIEVFLVEREKALALSRELDTLITESMAATPDRAVMRDGTLFVPREEPYRLGNNCNHVLARWLESLGVRVVGNRTVATVRVRPPRASDNTAQSPR